MADRVDAIIPTIPGREESLARLLRSLPADVGTIIIRDSETCGAGWTEGIERSDADYLLLACDDQEFLGPDWLDRCIETVDAGLIPCPRVWLPDGTIESQGGDMNAFAHVDPRPKRDWTPVDYTTVPFLRRGMAGQIGMLADCHYCTDVWVSYRGRQLGYETVLRHGFDVRHHREPVGRGAGMAQTERDGMDEATMREELARCGSWLPEVSEPSAVP